MKVIYKIKLDMARCGITPRIDAVQGDINTRYLELSLYDSGIAWKIPEAATVVIRFCKPDGTGGNYDALPNGDAAYTINGNTITVALAPQVCTVPGIVKLSVCLVNGDAELNTFAINIDVRKNPGLSVHSENYYKIAGSVADSGWEPDMYLGTDEDGKVVARQLDISRSLVLRLAAEDFTHGDVSYFTYSEAPAWDWLTSEDNLDFELTCVINGETYVYKKEDLYLDFSYGAFWGFSAPELTDPDAGVWASPGMFIGNRDGSFCVEVTMGSNNTGVFIMESCALKVYRKRNFVQTVNGIAPDESGNVEVEGVTDEQVASAVEAYLEENPVEGGGLSDDEKTLLIALFDNSTFNGVDMSATLNQLKNLFAGGEAITYPVTYNLTDVASDNMAEVAKEAFPFTATLSVSDGLLIREDSLSVTMGGKDITDAVYADGVITIPVVTGEIVITAEGKDAALLYALPKETVFDGTVMVDTGVHLFETSRPFTIAFEFTASPPASNVYIFSEIKTGTTEATKNGFAFGFKDGYRWRLAALNSYQDILTSKEQTNRKIVITYDPDSGTETTYIVADGALSPITRSHTNFTRWGLVGNSETMKLGAGYGGTSAGLAGTTVHSFEVHTKIWDEATINEFMGVS
ncbi:MAG: hypothetical protein IJ448_01500 [Oscillospiraceae bacterium]|nr:hypothetical protein [Oscillospiraceae bacterium]